MNRFYTLATAISISFSVGFFVHSYFSPSENQKPELKPQENIKLGAFSVSLSVKNLEESKEFYEALGFEVFGGAIESNYFIMKNENALIGLFQGMFEGNILTFNPGWDENAQETPDFDDIRKIQEKLKNQEIEIINQADEASSGPASFMLKDPDGNMILFDQHR
ncbi:VOC family protein [Algoriphagus sp. NG3]|uniref:VOC family protein n=1 Tax=Algoriphagus sp. NG3 TaxID=3097546 RepID=UPI002A81C762|nr:VOC family protein [Algoriphagus sp. NG3]WPR75561.1 VOC family protein [Algoriphagus sp. NG3]